MRRTAGEEQVNLSFYYPSGPSITQQDRSEELTMRDFRRTVILFFLVLLIAPVLAVKSTQGGSNTSSDAGGSAASGNANGGGKSSPGSSASSGPDTSDIGSWIAYQAMRVGTKTIAAQLNAITACTHFTFVSPADRIASSAVVKQVNIQVVNLKRALCKAEVDLAVGDHEECRGESKAFLPGLADVAAVAAAATGVVQLVSSLEPTYSLKSGPVTIDPLAAQRALIDNLGAAKVHGPRSSEADLDALLSMITNISQASTTIARAVNPGGPDSTKWDPAAKAWATKQSTANSAAQTFLSAVNDPAKTFIHDFLIAGSTSYMESGTCSVTIAPHAGAASFIGEKDLFNWNSYFETGVVVLSYEVLSVEGTYLKAGLVPITCELASEYKLGKGNPPSPDNVTCKAGGQFPP